MLQDTNFVQLARREPCAREMIRLLALAHVKQVKKYGGDSTYIESESRQRQQMGR
jgi:hypothetical protein